MLTTNCVLLNSSDFFIFKSNLKCNRFYFNSAYFCLGKLKCLVINYVNLNCQNDKTVYVLIGKDKYVRATRGPKL